MLRSLCLALVLLSLPALAKDAPTREGREFSADMILTKGKAPAQTMKVYFGKGKSRVEVAANGQEMVMISDLTDGKSFMLMPQAKMAMDLSGPMAQAMAQHGGGTQDVSSMLGNPCADEKGTGRTCKKIGTEKLDNRSVERWEIFEDGKKTIDAWIDPKLQLMVKGELPTGEVVQLKNIKFGAPPAKLFEIPGDYQMMAMPSGATAPGVPVAK